MTDCKNKNGNQFYELSLIVQIKNKLHFEMWNQPKKKIAKELCKHNSVFNNGNQFYYCCYQDCAKCSWIMEISQQKNTVLS